MKDDIQCKRGSHFKISYDVQYWNVDGRVGVEWPPHEQVTMILGRWPNGQTTDTNTLPSVPHGKGMQAEIKLKVRRSVWSIT